MLESPDPATTPVLDLGLGGRVAVVTGAGSGIGRGIALALGALGAIVVVAGRTAARCEETVDELRAEGGEGVAIAADVTDSGSVSELFDATVGRFGKVDVLVNNAGVQRVGWFDEMSDEDWDTVVDTNLKGPFITSREFARRMREHRFGRIVNVGSEACLVGAVGNTQYVAAKAGLMGLTMNMALEMAVWARKDPGDYTCNLVHPGFNESGMTEGHSEEQIARVLKNIPLGRAGDPQHDVGYAVATLASPAASYVTGAKFSAGGGIGMSLAS